MAPGGRDKIIYALRCSTSFSSTVAPPFRARGPDFLVFRYVITRELILAEQLDELPVPTSRMSAHLYQGTLVR